MILLMCDSVLDGTTAPTVVQAAVATGGQSSEIVKAAPDKLLLDVIEANKASFAPCMQAQIKSLGDHVALCQGLSKWRNAA